MYQNAYTLKDHEKPPKIAEDMTICFELKMTRVTTLMD